MAGWLYCILLLPVLLRFRQPLSHIFAAAARLATLSLFTITLQLLLMLPFFHLPLFRCRFRFSFIFIISLAATLPAAFSSIESLFAGSAAAVTMLSSSMLVATRFR